MFGIIAYCEFFQMFAFIVCVGLVVQFLPFFLLNVNCEKRQMVLFILFHCSRIAHMFGGYFSAYMGYEKLVDSSFCFAEFDVDENYANLIRDYWQKIVNLARNLKLNLILATTIHSVVCSFCFLWFFALFIFASPHTFIFTFHLGIETLNYHSIQKNQFSKSS